MIDRCLGRALKKDWSISSYRTEAGAGVDVVIETPDAIIGVEIKASRNVGRSDTRGLASLAETIGKYKRLKKRIAYLGDTEQAFDDGTRAYPYGLLLRRLAKE